MTRRLVDTENGEAVTIALPAVADGKVLVERQPSGRLDVIEMARLAVVNTDAGER